MKWVIRQYPWNTRLAAWLYARNEWHRWFAWRPVAIPATKHDEIVVPRHRVWLETVARSKGGNVLGYDYRTYTAEPTRLEASRQLLEKYYL